jgi:hypothetical protein
VQLLPPWLLRAEPRAQVVAVYKEEIAAAEKMDRKAATPRLLRLDPLHLGSLRLEPLR